MEPSEITPTQLGAADIQALHITPSDRTYDRALGCILGALVGDASGTLLEFS